MSRRFGRRKARGGSSGPSILSRLIALQPYSWLEADSYTIDGVTGKVGTFVDKVPAGTGIRAITASHAFTQTNTLFQVAIPSADAALRSQLSANFNLAPRYTSNSPASSWINGHNGNGFSAYCVLNRTTVTGTQFVWGSYTAVTAGLALVSSGDSLIGVARNAVGTIVVQATSAAGAIATGAGSNSISHRAADTPDMTVKRNGASIATADATGALAATDPGASMTIGDIFGGAAALNAKVAMILFFNRVLTAAEESIVASYRLSKFGVS